MVRPDISEKVALTYANEFLTDGAGAQLQRIYGIYALSRFLNLPYVHSPIKKIGYQGLVALENNSSVADLESRYNEIFKLDSDIDYPKNPTVHYLKNANLNFIENLRRTAKNESNFHLVKILLPYAVTDRNPEIYRCLKAVSPFPRQCSDLFKIVVHVRRGELFAVDSERMLPNSYYVSCVMGVINILKRLDIEFVCEVHTEAPSKVLRVTPTHHGINKRISRDIEIDPKMNFLEDLADIPNLAMMINLDPIETLRRMATADLLIMSHSSFSYVPAILNTTGIVIYHPFWHRPLQEWLVSDEKGRVPEAELIKKLGSWHAT